MEKIKNLLEDINKKVTPQNRITEILTNSKNIMHYNDVTGEFELRVHDKTTFIGDLQEFKTIGLDYGKMYDAKLTREEGEGSSKYLVFTEAALHQLYDRGADYKGRELVNEFRKIKEVPFSEITQVDKALSSGRVHSMHGMTH